MNSQTGLILKVLIFSLLGSILIKYAGPLMSIPPTDVNAAIIIMSLPLIVMLALIWRLIYQSSEL